MIYIKYEYHKLCFLSTFKGSHKKVPLLMAKGRGEEGRAIKKKIFFLLKHSINKTFSLVEYASVWSKPCWNLSRQLMNSLWMQPRLRIRRHFGRIRIRTLVRNKWIRIRPKNTQKLILYLKMPLFLSDIYDTNYRKFR